MKKTLRMSILATSAVLALAGSMMSCSQPIVPPATPLKDNELTTKDIFELQLGASEMKGESLFGKNVVYFSDVNYADNYVLYRFGPMDDPIKGTKIDLTSIGSNTNAFDGFVVEDKISTTNYMAPGSYTYKLIAKSAINSARAMADLNSTSKAPANQDYWANPSVDVVYLPSVASVTFSASAANLPAYKSKMALTKDEVKYVKENATTFTLIPGANKSGVEIVSEYDDPINKIIFTSKKNNSKDGDALATLTIPASSALNGKWKVYAQRKATEFSDGYYLDSDKVLLEEVTVKMAAPKADFKVLLKEDGNVSAGDPAKYYLTYDIKNEVADLYEFKAQRSEQITLKSPGLDGNKDDATAKVETATYYTDPVAVDLKVVETKGKEDTTWKCYDPTVQQDKKYIYFWTFTPKDNTRNTVTGACELTKAEFVTPASFKFTTITKVDNNTRKVTLPLKDGKEDTASTEYANVNFRFTSKVNEPKDLTGWELVQIKRIGKNNNKDVLSTTTIPVNADGLFKVGTDWNITVIDANVPFVEENMTAAGSKVEGKYVSQYNYNAVLKAPNGQTVEFKDILTKQNENTVENLPAISKSRVPSITWTLTSAEAINEGSVKATVDYSYADPSDPYGCSTEGLAKALEDMGYKGKIEYSISNKTNHDLLVVDGKTQDVSITKKNNKITLTLSDIKLVDGQEYTLSMFGKTCNFKYTKPAPKPQA